MHYITSKRNTSLQYGKYRYYRITPNNLALYRVIDIWKNILSYLFLGFGMETE